jgi:hypothetical protein
MPWKPSVPGEIPTLGYYVIDWMTEYLARPAWAEYEPFVPYLEQEEFILKWYAIDPRTGRFLYDRALLGRPRGWGKSPVLAALCAVEGLGDVVPDGWDADGQPVGRPWTHRTPNIGVCAVSEDQADYTWQPLLEMIREHPFITDAYPGLEPFDTIINLPRGKIEQRTASGRTQKGAPFTFATLDQTEEWVPSNGGPALAHKIRMNAAKNGGRTVEAPNAYVPGDGSVAEASHQMRRAVEEGRAKSKTLLIDHREAEPDTDLTNRRSLVLGLRKAYGDSSGHKGGCVLHKPPCPPGHVDLEPLINRAWDLASDENEIKSDILNQVTGLSDAWVTDPEWEAAYDEYADWPEKRDPVVLGFDGSLGRKKGKADATAFVMVGVVTGVAYCRPEWVWEEPDDWKKKPRNKGKTWKPPVKAVSTTLDDIMREFGVVGFYGDPHGWETQFKQWERKYGRRLKVKATANQPITYWPRAKATGAEGAKNQASARPSTVSTPQSVVEAVEVTQKAIVERELTHNGSAVLRRHVLNARMRPARNGYLIYKEYPQSPKKIDAAYALVLAWKCRLDALGVKGIRKSPSRQPVQPQEVLVLT